MSIQDNVNKANQLAYQNADGKTLAVIVNMNQLYLEYLDELETAPLKVAPAEHTVKLDGKTTIKFNGVEEIAEWIASHK